MCSECKIRSHLSHTPTDLNTVCDLAKRVIQEGLKQMQIRKREIDTSINYNRGLVFNHIQDFTQAKVNLKSRAKELKSCIDGILSTSIEEVENQEMLHRRSFKECFGELKRQSEKLGEKIRSGEISLDTLDPISLTFYRKKTAWNGIFRPFTSKTKIPKITRIMPKALDQAYLELCVLKRKFLDKKKRFLRQTDLTQLYQNQWQYQGLCWRRDNFHIVTYQKLEEREMNANAQSLLVFIVLKI